MKIVPIKLIDPSGMANGKFKGGSRSVTPDTVETSDLWVMGYV